MGRSTTRKRRNIENTLTTVCRVWCIVDGFSRLVGATASPTTTKNQTPPPPPPPPQQAASNDPGKVIIRLGIDGKDRRPQLKYLGFYGDAKGIPAVRQLDQDKSSHTEFSSRLTTWVVLLSVVCFLVGTFLTLAFGYLYYRKRRRLTSQLVTSPVMPCEVENPKLYGPCPEYFRFREGLVQDGAPVILHPQDGAPVMLHPQDGAQMILPPQDGAPVMLPQYMVAMTSSFDTDSLHEEEVPVCTWYTGVEEPFINQFSGKLGYEGGQVSCDDSDVVVTFPQGALPRIQTSRLHVNVSLHNDTFNIRPRHGDVQLSPMVELVCPGTRRFARPIQIKVPHRALLGLGTDWLLAVAVTNLGPTHPVLGVDTQWKYVTQQDKHTTRNNSTTNNRTRNGRTLSSSRSRGRVSSSGSTSNQNDVVFTYDNEYIYIRTDHPGAFTCIGRASQTGLLRQSGVIYAGIDEAMGATGGFEPTMGATGGFEPTMGAAGGFEPEGATGGLASEEEETRVKLRVYICDSFKDSCKAAEAADRRCHPYSLRISHHQSLSILSDRSWVVRLNSATEEDWGWKLQHGLAQSVKVISTSPRISDLAAITSTEFYISSSRATSIRALVALRQKGEQSEASRTTLITRDTAVEELKQALTENLVDDGMAMGSDASSFEDVSLLQMRDVDLLSCSSQPSPEDDDKTILIADDSFLNGSDETFLIADDGTNFVPSFATDSPLCKHRANLYRATQLIDYLSGSSDSTSYHRDHLSGSSDSTPYHRDHLSGSSDSTPYHRDHLSGSLDSTPYHRDHLSGSSDSTSYHHDHLSGSLDSTPYHRDHLSGSSDFTPYHREDATHCNGLSGENNLSHVTAHGDVTSSSEGVSDDANTPLQNDKLHVANDNEYSMAASYYLECRDVRCEVSRRSEEGGIALVSLNCGAGLTDNVTSADISLPL